MGAAATKGNGRKDMIAMFEKFIDKRMNRQGIEVKDHLQVDEQFKVASQLASALWGKGIFLVLSQVITVVSGSMGISPRLHLKKKKNHIRSTRQMCNSDQILIS